MLKSRRVSSLILVVMLLVSFLLVACGDTTPTTGSATTAASAVTTAAQPATTAVSAATTAVSAATTAVSAATTLAATTAASATTPAAATTTAVASSNKGPVTLKFYHWFGGDAGPVVAEINKRFQQENPNITIEFESAPTDQYQTVIRTRLASGDAPDVMGVFPGAWKDPFVKAGYLMDLSNQPWVSRLDAGAKGVVVTDGKVYALPTDLNVIGVTYNKKIFADLGLSIPKTWDEFLQVCQKIKDANITPLALGNKDQWVTQLIPYAMAPSVIYRDNPSFDQQMYDGKANFAGSAWNDMMRDYLDLDKRGFFNKASLGTTYDQTVQLMASGKAAMVVNGNWILAPIKKAQPDIDLGMFVLPYVKTGQPTWVSSSVGGTMGISAKTKYPDEARKYLQFWARADIAALYVQEKKAYSTLTDVQSELDPAAKEMLPYLKVGSYNFLDQKWPAGVQDVMFKDIQAVFSGGISAKDMLTDMDKTFQEAKSKQ